MEPRPTSLVLSVVVPMYNEADVLPLMFARLRPALDKLGYTYEVVAVDDGSSDKTAEIVQAQRLDWPGLRLVRLLRNSGHQSALTAGLRRSHGEFVVTLDADLQDPPEAIGPMLEMALSQNLDVVYGVRSDRSSDSVAKRTTAGLYYRVMRRVAGSQVPAEAGDFRLISKRVVETIDRLPEHGRVYRLLVPWFGFPSGELPYVREERAAGRTKYPWSKMVRLGLDSVTAFTAAPLRLATWTGLLGGALCVALMVWAFAASLTGGTVPGWTSTLLIVMGLGAVQLVCLGLLGEYIARLFVAAQQRPMFMVGYDSDELPVHSAAVNAHDDHAAGAVVGRSRGIL